MAFKIYKFEIEAPTTATKVKGFPLPLDTSKGNTFRIKKAWVNYDGAAAIAAADQMGIQIHYGNRDEQAAFLDLNSENEIFTDLYDFHLAEAALTELYDPLVCLPIRDIEGTRLETNKKNIISQLVTGTVGGTAKKMFVKLLAQYENAQDPSNWNDQGF